MDNRSALDPGCSVVVEACAGSGKTWLLVSRIVRLLLDGARPSQILAITFTRKAAQEMQARLHGWLRELATRDESYVRNFFAERGLGDLSNEQLGRARSLYAETLLAQPGIAIGTFHGWFMQVMRRAPLNADAMQGMSLLERPGSVQEEAWEELLEQMRRQPDGPEAQHMQWLFAECGLHNTRKLLSGFLAKRAEWWAYAQGQNDGVEFALRRLRAALDVDMAFDPIADWGACSISEEAFFAFVRQYAADGTDAQKNKASELERAWTDNVPEARYDAVYPLLYTGADEPRSFKPTKKQNAEAFLVTRDALFDNLQLVRDILADQQTYRLNAAVLHCGAALLERYQTLKRQKQQMDFADLEWQLCRLLQHGEHAETMQYKLDSRYRHVLLDEFQDTNPLQWQILRAWFDASVAVDSQPTVFLVGDPKQSIYRFRRADARLFGVARDYLAQHFGARELHNNRTRRNAPPIVAAVNAVFREQPQGFEFAEHETHQHDLPGHVLVLPLQQAEDSPIPNPSSQILQLRDPLTTPREQAGEGARHQEAKLFAAQLQAIVAEWRVRDGGSERRTGYGDIMVLVRSRTHLAIYEEALRAKHIPFISSRRGGLLDTLEAEDLQALLMFLITPFADLALAQVLRSPVFACSDEDLMLLSGFGISDLGFSGAAVDASAEVLTKSQILNPKSSSWWSRLQHAATQGVATPALQRAHRLLTNWLALADKLPVHDLLDRVYFEGDVLARYAAVLPPETRAKARANLNAFMEIALAVDAGRYPSLPRFLQELRELRNSTDDAPDEGKLGSVGNAVRIYTVHESKGLEAPIVWLLDAHAEKNNNREGYDMLLDWPPDAAAPAHFSAHTDLASRGSKRAPLFEHEAAQQAREEMNLLYVAMTRAQQALIVSGSQGAKSNKTETWYERIAAATNDGPNPLHLASSAHAGEIQETETSCEAIALPPIVPVGQRAIRNSEAQQRGIWLHALLQHLAETCPSSAGGGGGVREQAMNNMKELQHRLALPAEQFEPLLQQAMQLLAAPHLARFFDATRYRAACNEMPYVNSSGEVKRIDRLVEFDDEVWILDYKLGESEDASRYRAQMHEYREAMKAVYARKLVKCALVFADGRLQELE